MNEVLVHCGGWEATQADLAAVPVPESTGSYQAVPYGRFLEELNLHIPRFGFTVESQSYALAREGSQMFGVIKCINGNGRRDYCLAIGIRNSYDRSLSLGLVAGHSVFCCDNLAFSGEVKMARKHTANVFRDLPDLIYRMLQDVSTYKERQDQEIGRMKQIGLDRPEVNHLIMESVRANAIPASQIPKVVQEWEEPRYDEFTGRNAWSLYNAFTSVQKSRSPRVQMDDTLRLTDVFRRLLLQ